MLLRTRFVLALLLTAGLCAGSLQASSLTDSLKPGTPDLKSAGPLAFGPEGVLFVGDPQGAAIFAIDTGDRPSTPASGPLKVDKIDEAIASLLGTTAKDIAINDLAVNPMSGNAYLSVARGKGPDAKPAILRVDRKAKIQEVPLKDVKFAKTVLANAKVDTRQEAITHLAYVNGTLYVAGLSNEEFASQFRSIPFPFGQSDKGTGVEIYHGSHGKFETNSPIRTFVAYEIKGEANLLAAYTCTPLVKIPVKELKPGSRVKGTTVAELGNRNKPLDMIVYQKGGKDYILMANSSRGVMKVSTDNIEKIDPITKKVSDKAGLTYETIAELKGIQQLDKLDKDNALVLVQNGGGMNLETIPLP